jgi:hypothetical protein
MKKKVREVNSKIQESEDANGDVRADGMRRKTGMEISPEIFARLKVRAAQRQVPLWRVVQDAFEAYLKVEPEEDAIPRHLWQYPAKFRRILASGHPSVLTAATKSVDTWLELVELSAPTHKGT